ncbi:MAG: hypothetical protein JJU31_12125 [Wenzhouxiangella sp.]|nr:hypothetical protein [Wenzhouxiangella sp.]TVR92751.1 MAG: class I SAM-dependent methyltransferase [Wenzhouxiangellaceae bacterium]
MRRLQLFEFNEAVWLPATLRALITDYLVCLTRMTGAFELRLRLLAQALRHSSQPQRIIDLCSGSGGPWHHLADRLDRRTPEPIEIVLTDLYPETAEHQQCPPGVSLHDQPLDATDSEARLAGLQTLFNAFHQFPPPQAKAVLARAVAQGEPIAIMELLQRRWQMLPLIILTPLMVLLLTPWIRPFRWWRLALTYLLPLAPLLITWDSLVSWLRCYRPEELLELSGQIDASQFHWEAGSYWYRGAPVTYLVGYPINECDPADAAGAPAAPTANR